MDFPSCIVKLIRDYTTDKDDLFEEFVKRSWCVICRSRAVATSPILASLDADDPLREWLFKLKSDCVDQWLRNMLLQHPARARNRWITFRLAALRGSRNAKA